MNNPTTMTLAQLTTRAGCDVLPHLARDIAIPICDGIQAQGDVIVIPTHRLPDVTAHPPWTDLPTNPTTFVSGTHDHQLVADPDTCRITRQITDPEELAVAAIDTTAPVWLIHRQHGASGIAPGQYIIRRQREQADQNRLVTD